MYRYIKASELLNSDNIIKYLKILDNKLAENDMYGEINLFGGAVMCLAFNARASTHDIDAIFSPKSEIRSLISEISNEYDLPKDWLNDAVKGFTSPSGNMIPYEIDSLTHLSVFMASPEYMLAMKCLSCRMDYENSTEIDDIKFLINYLHLTSVEEVENIILQFYPKSMYKPKTHYMLLELFDGN